MKYAPVVPTSGLRVLEYTKVGYHLCLAQHLLREKEYRSYYRTLGKLGHFIIVDNGAAERDQPSFEEVVKVANYVGASEIVMPDVVFDLESTIRGTMDIKALALVPPHKRFIVPQGRNWQEVEECLLAMHARLHGQYATIGLSKYHWQFQGGRPAFLRGLVERHEGILMNKNVHVLGVGCDPFQEITDLWQVWPHLRGIDSGCAVAWAQRLRPLPDPAWTGEHIPLEWNEPFDLKLAARNILNIATHAANPAARSESTDLPYSGRFGY